MVAFFSINSNGAVNVRKSGDYIAKSIALAGGQYVSYDESEEEKTFIPTFEKASFPTSQTFDNDWRDL